MADGPHHKSYEILYIFLCGAIGRVRGIVDNSYAFTLTQTFVYAWWMVGAIVGLLRCRQVAWEQLLLFLVARDAKYSAKMILLAQH